MAAGRNDPCPCGSGKKYKTCCLTRDQAKALELSAQADQDDGAADFPSGAMGDSATPDGSLRRKIMAFANASDPGGKHFRRAQREWDGEGRVDYAGAEGLPRFLSLMDYFVHDYLFPQERKYLLDLFHESQARDLPEAERVLLEGWLDNHRACYEVQEVRPGVDARLKDIVTGREYLVYSEKASRQLAKWDVFYARLTKLGDGWEMTGTAEMIRRHNKPLAVAYLKHEFAAFRQENPGATLEAFLKTFSPKTRRFMASLSKERPVEITTASGELLTPAEAVFDLRDPLAVQAKLDAMEDFSFLGDADDRPGGLRYDWLRRGPSLNAAFGPERPRSGTLRFLSEWLPDGRRKAVPILGNLTLAGAELLASCLSQERLDALVALLEQRLGALVRFKKSKRIPLEDLRKEKKDETSVRQLDMPPEVKAKVMKRFLEGHYRRWKDTPLDSLGGLTPRQAAKDPAQQVALDEVLKDIENIEERQKMSGQVVYGADRLRAELKLGASG